MNSDELIVNIQCVEHGIVPIGGMPIEHVKSALSDLDDEARRKCTRKFRKILKKAIKHQAAEYYVPGTTQYKAFVDDYRRRTGINRSGHRFTFTKSERSLRKGIVVRYLSHIET